ncbi:efflux RND transporter permease subunit [Indioceanicola profundi]|uniref:efflux RND transporter permease subunit n=1 Tax=Indioceanicola profundi TaxID=2220096 RepID=UPI0013C4D42B|nr:efflux RND transporter permease subunit [Indioceanicola profundi]
MTLSELSVRRPIGAMVLNLLLVVFGLVALQRLSVREAPDIDPPIVTIETSYTGASAEVVETRVTRIIEDQLAGIEGIETIQSQSEDGESDITIEFSLDRDVDVAANDVRDRVNRALDDLPEEIDPPEVIKVDSNADEVMWLSLRSDSLDPMALTDLVDRLLVDRLTAVDGVARVRIGGERRPAMRIWLDRQAMAARGVTANDVEAALRAENVELPAGRLESAAVDLSMRVDRGYSDPATFARLPVATSEEGATIRLGEISRIEVGPAEPNVVFRSNGQTTVGLGIVSQSQANLLELAAGVKAEMERALSELPGGLTLGVSYDSSVFVEAALNEVVGTLIAAAVLVVAVILLFLGSPRATLIPAITMPVALIGGLAGLYVFGFSINILTLLAFVLATGLVVDDAIVVLENIWRRIENGENPKEAAANGGSQVFFAVIATTAVLVAVFLPIGLQTGDTGRLFREFSLTIAATVAVSSLAALTLVPAISGLILKRQKPGRIHAAIDSVFRRIEDAYRGLLERLVDRSTLAVLVLLGAAVASVLLYRAVPQELVPPEDRGGLIVALNPPEGAGFDYSAAYLTEVEAEMLKLVESGEARQLLLILFGGPDPRPRAIMALSDWEERERSQEQIVAELSSYLGQLPGVDAFARGRPALGQSGGGRPVQFVIGGPTYEVLADWRDRIIERAEENSGLVGLDADYDERRPQILISIDAERAAELGVPASAIGNTLQTMFGSRNVTTFAERGEEYDVILQAEDADRRSPTDLANVYVRSTTTGAAIPLSNLISFTEGASAAELNRFNRTRAVTIEAGLAPGYSLGEALEYLQQVAAEELPEGAYSLDYKGESRDFLEAQSQGLFTFGLALLVVFLVLAAQFESIKLPVAIILTVPLAVTGALLGLWLTGLTLNIYSQIGMVMLVGIAAKNGILLLEFATQLEAEGRDPRSAAVEAAVIRFRPVLMTALSTAAGAVPLLLSGGAGSEVRTVVGVVILAGIGVATALTLLLIPALFPLIRRKRGGAAQPVAAE